MDFHFLVMEKSWKINVEKEGAPCRYYNSSSGCCDHNCWNHGLFCSANIFQVHSGFSSYIPKCYSKTEQSALQTIVDTFGTNPGR